MKKTLLSIAAGSLFLAGCFEKDDAAAPKEEWYLSKFTTIQVGRTDTTTTTVKLNTDKKLTEFTESGINGGTPWYSIVTATLEGNKLTQIKEKRESDQEARLINSLEYNGDKIAKINYYGSNGVQDWGITGYNQMVYNAQGRLSEIRILGVPTNIYATLFRVTWENDNVKSVTTFNVVGTDTSQANTNVFYYDTKPNILKPFFTGTFFWWDAPTAVEHLSANNLVKREVFFNQELYHRVTYERIFNDRNQVTQQKEITETLKEQMETHTKVTTFTYVKK